MDERTAELMADEDARATMAANEFDHEFLATHLADERRKASLLGEIREAIFGAQDGLVSTLAVVSTVAGATAERHVVLIAGIASGLAGIFSMAAGEYIGSKSQREIFEAQIVDEREEVHDRPGEAEAEIAYMFEEDGLPRESAVHLASIMAEHPEVLLKTMVEKELGLMVEPEEGSPMQGALVMGAAFGLGAIVPILPHLFLVGGQAVIVSVVLTLAVLFGIGVAKSRWTHRTWLASGAEILVIGAIAGVIGYFFGSILPGILGVPEAAV
jgi:VIT1/CCC1 family predicted Fe2+/Mn2+ transporter